MNKEENNKQTNNEKKSTPLNNSAHPANQSNNPGGRIQRQKKRPNQQNNNRPVQHKSAATKTTNKSNDSRPKQVQNSPGNRQQQEKRNTVNRPKRTTSKKAKEEAKHEAFMKETLHVDFKQKQMGYNLKRHPGGPKLRVMVLGGLDEIGENMTVLEYGNDIIIIDCGCGFPGDDMLGVDLLIPDMTYLEKNADKVRGLFLTHGHEDHIGAIPYLLKKLNVPIYATKLTLGVLGYKLNEHNLLDKAKLITVEAGSTIRTGVFQTEFIRVNHSIADACCLAIRTPVGTVIHSGDFKLDVSPIDGQMMDLTRIGEYGKEGVLLLMCESTNIEKEGYTPSERQLENRFDNIFAMHSDKRIVVATFASNVHRVQQIINTSIKYGRKVVLTGRSMTNVIKAAVDLKYMSMPENTLLDLQMMDKYPPEKITVITTGSQGEPMSGLYRMAFSDHPSITLSSKDLVIISASRIPGNEKTIDTVVNEIYKRGVNVYHDQAELHVSGHACREEIKLMHALTKPKYFIPVHGEYKHLIQHKELAEFMGMSADNIFVSNIGDVVEFDGEKAQRVTPVQAGHVIIDGTGVGDVGGIVLRDRKKLAEDGIIIVVATIDMTYKEITNGPEIVSRGFVYVRESEELIAEIKNIAKKEIEATLDSGHFDWNTLKSNISDSLTKFISSKVKRKPMILPIIMNI